MKGYTFPGRLLGLLRQMAARYRYERNEALASLVETARWGLDLGVTVDNWNGGQYGHEVILYLPLEALVPLDTASRSVLCDRIKEDLNVLSTRSNEFVCGVHLELADENSPEFQAAQDYQFRPAPDPVTLDFWKPGLVRCFISHRDAHKAEAHRLAEALEEYGISCFVAHDTVGAMKEWRKEIMAGLQTMEIMVVMLTEDFHQSTFTNQEVGFALGAQKPVVCLKLGQKAPEGFVEHIQAVTGKLDQIENSASRLYRILGDALGAADRLNNGLIEAFVLSPSYTDAIRRFDRMTKAVTKLTADQADRVVDGFNANDQLYGCGYLTSHNDRMIRWMRDITGEAYELHERRLRRVPKASRPRDPWEDGEMPF